MNEAILLALSDEPFSSVQQMADSPQDMLSNSYDLSSACRFSAFHSQTTDIFIGFLTSSPTVGKQIKSSRGVDPTSPPPVVHPASRTGWRYTLPFDESWFYLSTDQIMR
jgi:hypothetical protein